MDSFSLNILEFWHFTKYNQNLQYLLIKPTQLWGYILKVAQKVIFKSYL